MVAGADYLSCTSLHTAVDYDAPIGTIRALLRANDTCPRVQDRDGKTPLILACEEISQPYYCRPFPALFPDSGDRDSVSSSFSVPGTKSPHLAASGGDYFISCCRPCRRQPHPLPSSS
uniref:Uncharacterized protein n=1 Tax=Pseudictyota dubia TaxID=2749911 RepID=A0A7R9W862_9STRA|mmetsp:Transcript_38913/g.71882  ORF Transcript_38913/g.71882 Transcript_38913/m.71882 type:complete len:118 (+) Transcript_38913:896-1249(+)